MPESKPRDEREELGEEKQKQADGSEDNRDPKNPRDPEDRGTTDPESGTAETDPQQVSQPIWLVRLPSKVRDALVRRDFDTVPPRYREFVRRYYLWLLKMERERRQPGER